MLGADPGQVSEAGFRRRVRAIIPTTRANKIKQVVSLFYFICIEKRGIERAKNETTTACSFT